MLIHDMYLKNVENYGMVADPAQLSLISYFDNLLENYTQEKSVWFFQKKVFKGIYLWGGVGVGKTYLMDLFYDAIPGDRKKRLHWHAFMKMIQADLQKYQGTVSPLKSIAKALKKEIDILCFDEFVVVDITEAMILALLLEALFDEGLIFVTTSNLPPEELYKNGLQRNRFLPAIDLLVKNTHIIHLATKRDYRRETFFREGTYFFPLNQDSAKAIQECFLDLIHHSPYESSPLLINEREIAVIGRKNTVIWFDFSILCAVPRSKMDYLSIAENYEIVLLSNVPKIAADNLNAITYFIYLVDIFYDYRVKLMIEAAVPCEEIYTEGRMLFEFGRTKSRLREMQSLEYFEASHRN